MAVGDTSSSLPHRFLSDKKQPIQQDEEALAVTTALLHSRHHTNPNTNDSIAFKPQLLLPPHHFRSTTPFPLPPPLSVHKEHQDFVADLAPHMARSMLQHDDNFDFDLSGTASPNLESSWDSVGSPQSTLWSPLGGRELCWETTACDAVGMPEKIRFDGRDNSKYYHAHRDDTRILKASNVGLCSSQSLIQQQIRTIQLSRIREEQTLSLKKKLGAYKNREEYDEPKEQNIPQFQNKGFGNGRRTRLAAQPPPLLHQQPGSEALLLGDSGSRGASCGTGFFLPRGRTGASSESRKRTGKGCSNVLIPARVVQALQLHFDQIAATSGPRAVGFPPLQDVLVSNRNGMYSLHKRQSRKAPENMQNEMILPQEWTY